MSWKTVALGDICEFIRGLTYSKIDEVEFSNNAVLRATNIDLESNKLNLEEIRYINSSVKINEDKKVKLNDILICTASGSKSHLGKVAFINEQLDMAFGGFMAVLRVKENIEAKFLFNYLTSDIFLNHISQLAEGANINNLKFSQIQNLKINLPPLPIQQKIVAKLDAIFAEIDKATAAVEANANNVEALFQSYLKQVFKRGVEVWKKDILTNICNVTTGKWDANHAVENGAYRFYTCASQFLYCDTKRYDGKNIVLPGNGANVGELYFYDGAFDAYQRTYVLSEIKIIPEYLFYHLKSNWEETNRFKQYGSATNFLKIGNFKNYIVSYPAIEEQKNIVAKLDSISEELRKSAKLYTHKVSELVMLKQSILKQAFNGELVKAA